MKRTIVVYFVVMLVLVGGSVVGGYWMGIQSKTNELQKTTCPETETITIDRNDNWEEAYHRIFGDYEQCAAMLDVCIETTATCIVNYEGMKAEHEQCGENYRSLAGAAARLQNLFQTCDEQLETQGKSNE